MRTDTRSNDANHLSNVAKYLKIACWNVRIILDSSDRGCPERRSNLVAHELTRLEIDIAALSEVRLPEEGSLKEHGTGYSLYWSGKPPSERRRSVVGFMRRNSIAPMPKALTAGYRLWLLFTGFGYKKDVRIC
ncbi:Hypothetical predicted protein [Octopus vulgaris]|uniref:Craniofacial development protein 2-like n=1 Tax=Octopus vulgaris TaxID=6645 RepID=A0AA36BHD6_OCTVU|nr:Hypothetical predicted protein [Octopus vulgaris]